MRDRLNRWRQRVYHDPAHILREFRQLELETPSDVDPSVARLRTGGLKRDREGRDAVLFTYGMSKASGKRIGFARLEDEDYDFVTAWIDANETTNFTPVQLKELVPEDLNPAATLDVLLRQLAAQYPRPTSTVLAIRLNRTAKLDDLLTVPLPPIGFAEVWYFCAVSPDAQLWALFGDAKANLRQVLFEYPSRGTPHDQARRDSAGR